MLYFAFVYPHLMYGIEIYANCHQKELKKLNVVNSKIIHVLLNKNIPTPVNELYVEFDVLPIPLLFEKQILHS